MTDQTFIREWLKNRQEIGMDTGLHNLTKGAVTAALARVVMELVEERASGRLEHPGASSGQSVTNAAGEPAPEVAPQQADFETVREELLSYREETAAQYPAERTIYPGERRKAERDMSAIDGAIDALDRLQDRMRRMEEALIIVEDAASRSPWSTEIWPNGMHPNAGVSLIRAALGARTDGK